MQTNLQGEIGSQISTIEHVEQSQSKGVLDVEDLEISRRWRKRSQNSQREATAEERSASRHREKSNNPMLQRLIAQKEAVRTKEVKDEIREKVGLRE